MVVVYIDGKPINWVLSIGRDDISGDLILTFKSRKDIPKISRFRYHKVELKYVYKHELKVAYVVIIKGFKRRKNDLYLKISDLFMEKQNEM